MPRATWSPRRTMPATKKPSAHNLTLTGCDGSARNFQYLPTLTISSSVCHNGFRHAFAAPLAFRLLRTAHMHCLRATPDGRRDGLSLHGMSDGFPLCPSTLRGGKPHGAPFLGHPADGAGCHVLLLPKPHRQHTRHPRPQIRQTATHRAPFRFLVGPAAGYDGLLRRCGLHRARSVDAVARVQARI